MRLIHWLMLLALALAVAPRLGAAVVRAQERADRVQYAQGTFFMILQNYDTALRLAQEDVDVAMWAIKQDKRRRANGRSKIG